MPTRILEFHGHKPLSTSGKIEAKANNCPFTHRDCVKKNGACSLKSFSGPPVIICPNRLYAHGREVIKRVAEETFGGRASLVSIVEAERRRRSGSLIGDEVVAFGKGYEEKVGNTSYGGELGIKAPSGDGEGDGGTFKIDYLLVKLDSHFKPSSIVAVEVQTIDTTNSYGTAAKNFYAGKSHPGYGKNPVPRWTEAGFNWENVTKRILPQIIYKGHALRRERLAEHGLFFILPDPVLSKIMTRVGGSLLEYPKGPGTVTFHSYQVEYPSASAPRPLSSIRSFTTTVEQIAYAFVSPQNLPPLGIYENTIERRMSDVAGESSV